MFPTNIMAGTLGFKVREFFEVGAAESEAINKPVEAKF